MNRISIFVLAARGALASIPAVGSVVCCLCLLALAGLGVSGRRPAS